MNNAFNVLRKYSLFFSMINCINHYFTSSLYYRKIPRSIKLFGFMSKRAIGFTYYSGVFRLTLLGSHSSRRNIGDKKLVVEFFNFLKKSN